MNFKKYGSLESFSRFIEVSEPTKMKATQAQGAKVTFEKVWHTRD